MKKFIVVFVMMVAVLMMGTVSTAEECLVVKPIHTGGTTISVDGASGVTAYNFSGWDTGMKYNGVGITSGANGILKTTGYKTGKKVDSVANGSGVFSSKSVGSIGTVIASGSVTGTGCGISGISIHVAGVAGKYTTSSIVKVSGRTNLR
jgi:hypothetical protein